MHHSAYPLSWPASRARVPTRSRGRAKFKSTFAAARDGLLDELRLLRVTNVILSTNVELRRDGLPYANRSEPDDPAVAVYFQRKGKEVCFACDRWDRVADNLRAVALTIEAIRGIERWGTGEMVDAAFSGFGALPPARSAEAPTTWWLVLGVQAHDSTETVTASYRRQSLEHHPDRGGDPGRMAAINAAWDQFRKERGL